MKPPRKPSVFKLNSWDKSLLREGERRATKAIVKLLRVNRHLEIGVFEAIARAIKSRRIR